MDNGLKPLFIFHYPLYIPAKQALVYFQQADSPCAVVGNSPQEQRTARLTADIEAEPLFGLCPLTALNLNDFAVHIRQLNLNRFAFCTTDRYFNNTVLDRVATHRYDINRR